MLEVSVAAFGKNKFENFVIMNYPEHFYKVGWGNLFDIQQHVVSTIMIRVVRKLTNGGKS